MERAGKPDHTSTSKLLSRCCAPMQEAESPIQCDEIRNEMRMPDSKRSNIAGLVN